jgi:outer membrane protein assembly factor BamB
VTPRFPRRILAGRMLAFSTLVLALAATVSRGGDWPQWRGPNRDARVTGFTPPKTWPKELKQEWKVTVGDGVATPALVGEKLYVFSWEEGKEVLRCLNAGTGKEEWKDSYEAKAATGPAGGYKGARSSPAVAHGKVVTLGVQGTVSCLDADTGKLVWRKENTGHPKFFTSSSPAIAQGLCIVQTGGEGTGGVAAYKLDTGEEKWKWSGDSPAYASPVLMTVDGTSMLVAETSSRVIGLGMADGKLLWKVPCDGRYNASTPVVDGQTVIFAGSSRGTVAVRIEKDGDGYKAADLWANKENNVIYNSPVVHDGLVVGITPRDVLYCLNEKDGKTDWTEQLEAAKGGGGKGKGGGMGGGAGYGSVVDAGTVFFSLTPAGKLVVFEPTGKGFKELASYKVGTGTYAYPVISGNRIYIKDRDSVTLYTIE